MVVVYAPLRRHSVWCQISDYPQSASSSSPDKGLDYHLNYSPVCRYDVWPLGRHL